MKFCFFVSLASESLFLFAHDFFLGEMAIFYIQPRLQNPTIPRIRRKGAREEVSNLFFAHWTQMEKMIELQELGQQRT